MRQGSLLKRVGKMLYYKTLCILLDPKSHALDPYEKAPLRRRFTQWVPWNHQAAVRLIITGKVTGVGFRAWIKRKARVNGLDCQAVNRNASTVEALLIGSGEQMEKVVRASWRGPKRAKVLKVKECWFNKPVKAGTEEKSLSKDVDHVSWSQETADCYKRVMAAVRSIMEEPNTYTVESRLVGTDELERAAKMRNIFFIRCRKKEIFFVSPEKRIGLQRSQTTRVPSIVHSLTDHKQLTKDFLQYSGLPVPEGRVFTDLQKAKEYLKDMEWPMVVKPAVGLNGSGVTVDVRTEEALEAAWDYGKEYHEEMVLEELVQGVDIRVVIIGGVARAALLRIPAHVRGDGKKTIEELVDEKNRIRLQNPRLRKNLIIPDDYSSSYLKRQGHSFSSIPEKDEVVFLHLKANICKGAESVSVTDFIHPDLMHLAQEAACAFGIDDFWGIDLLVERIDKPREGQRAVIIELNSTANIENVIYPLYGPTFDSAKSIIGHLFPEDTKDSSYPEDQVKVQITGVLNQDFFDWAQERSAELELTGKVCALEKGAEALLSGQRHHMLFYLSEVWDWKKGGFLVDGLQVHSLKHLPEGQEMVIETASLQSPVHEETFGLEEMEENWYSGDAHYLKQDLDINRVLFLEAFKRRGYTAKLHFNDLIEIRKDEDLGITGLKHSTLFCDMVCKYLFPAKKLLALHGLPVSRGARFKSKHKKRSREYFEEISKPCVVTRLHPKGFVSNRVRRKKRFKRVWERAYKKGTNNMLIEEHVPGHHVFIAVVNGEAAGALVLAPVSIVGDGVSTIAELIEEKNSLREKNPWYRGHPIPSSRVESRVTSAGYTLADILPFEEKMPLESAPRFQIGGETANISTILHDDFKERAVEAVQVFPGLSLAVVHLIIPFPGQPAGNQRWVVEKIDTEPAVAAFHFPWRGEACLLADRVVEDLCLADETKWILRE